MIRWKTSGIKTNPTADVPLRHVDNTTQRVLSSAETGRLVATLDKPPHRKIKTIMLRNCSAPGARLLRGGFEHNGLTSEDPADGGEWAQAV